MDSNILKADKDQLNSHLTRIIDMNDASFYHNYVRKLLWWWLWTSFCISFFFFRTPLPAVATRLHCVLSVIQHSLRCGETTGSAATDVCLSAVGSCILAHISFSWCAHPVTYGGWEVSVGVGGGAGSDFFCSEDREKKPQTCNQTDIQYKATTRLDAHWHMLSCTNLCISYRKDAHTYTLTYTLAVHTSMSNWLTHLASQEAMGPVGQRKLESLVHLFTSNYRNRTISATAAPAFLYPLERIRKKKEKKNPQSSDSPFSQQRTVISSLQHR